MNEEENKPLSVGRSPSNRSASVRATKHSRPSPEETKVIERLTRELVKRGDFKIRFVERLEEEDYPTLLIFIALPRGIQPGDAEILQLHEVANQISESSSIDVMITVSAISGRGRRLEYESAEIAMNIGSEVLADLPNFFASAALLRSSMKMTAAGKSNVNLCDLSKNLQSLAEVFFYLGHKAESMKILKKLEQLLERVSACTEQDEELIFSQTFFEFNKIALLYAQFQDYEKAYSIIDQNFERLRSFIDNSKILLQPEKTESLSLPKDITFARQELREKIQFFQDKHLEIPLLCESVIALFDSSEGSEH